MKKVKGIRTMREWTERVDGESQAVAAPSGALQISPRLWNQLFSGEPVVDSEAHHLVFVFPPS